MDYGTKTLIKVIIATLVCFLVVMIMNFFWQDEISVACEAKNNAFIKPKQPEIVVVEEESSHEVILSKNEEIERFRLLGEFKVSAYCSCAICCEEWANNRPNGIVYGASGEELVPYHSIAVDTDVIPYGKSVFIDGIEYVAHDCGGAIKGNRIDIYMDSHEAAVEFGVKNMMVYEREY